MLADIQAAQVRLHGVARHTPLILDDQGSVWLKPESLQPIGSFKIRGAYNRLAQVAPEVRAAGVIAYSSGNHAQGVAYAARLLGVPAVIVMPNNAPAIKVAATRAYGAEVVFYDPQTERREDVAARLMQGKTWTLVPPYDHPDVIAGQGTIGLEIAADLPDVELALTPVGGGGLISGIAAALKSLKPSVKVIGVESALAADAQSSLRGGQLVEWTAAQTNRTIADGTRTLSLSPLTFAHVQQYVDDIVTVSETEIRDAVRHLALHNKLVIEPSGALAFAAYRFHHAELPPASRVVVVLSGGNIEPALLAEILQG
jgi:threonine dehydratase